MNRQAKEAYLAMLEEKRKRVYVKKCRGNFWEYCLHMDHKFFKEREEVLKSVAIDMQRLVAPIPPMTEIDIMNVSLPPRTGKSYLCSLFVTWCIGKFPTESFMRNTVTGKLYDKFSNDIKDIIKGETHRGRFSEIFPDVKLATERTDGWKVTDSEQGVTYFGAGIEGTIIGFGATKLSIVDDSVKDEFDALNESSLEKKWAWYTSAADSREEEGCKKLFIGTRWSLNDIVGKLKKLGFFNGPKALDVIIPALINGKSFCEAIHKTATLLKKKALTSDLIWSAEWMQKPITKKGMLYKSEEMNWYSGSIVDKLGPPDAIMSKVDTADTGADALCHPIGYVYGQIGSDNVQVYIEDVNYTTEGVEVTEPEVARKIIDHKVEVTDVESNNGGKSYSKNIQRIIESEQDELYCNITSTMQMKNKHTRILMKAGYIKKHFYFKEDTPEGSEYSEYIKNILQYQKNGKSKHDDGPDATTGLAEMITEGDDGFFEFV